MKIAVSTTGNSLDAELDQRFGRAPRFLIVDTDSGNVDVVDNVQNLNAAQGAGIQSAMTIAGTGAQAVITGHCGPKAFRVLSEAGIKIYNTEAKTVREAITLYSDGKLNAADNADVEGHWL
ncbi:MAG: NifB/NifX family molybdenum-iron cluster-binding protein [Victivallales bacterium]|nr:NifB/NifX family molybdenum-iron cluster-binding protein [Victivallales bacterium]